MCYFTSYIKIDVDSARGLINRNKSGKETSNVKSAKLYLVLGCMYTYAFSYKFCISIINIYFPEIGTT